MVGETVFEEILLEQWAAIDSVSWESKMTIHTYWSWAAWRIVWSREWEGDCINLGKR